MTKQELGTKRLCARCGLKFYDLHHSPITCPKCGTVFETAPVGSRFGSEPARTPGRGAEFEMPETDEAKFVSLGDGEAVEGEEVEPEEEVEPDDAGMNGAVLIEEIEGDEAEVTDVIEGDEADE
jgi:uncharacterized protein (TIGR02300 family)